MMDSFLVISSNISEQLFQGTPSDGCFLKVFLFHARYRPKVLENLLWKNLRKFWRNSPLGYIFLAYRNFWTLDVGLWMLDSGRWTQDTGLRTLDFRCWTLDVGLRMLDSGHWTQDAGPRALDFGRWTLDAERWTLDAGLWTLDAGCWTLDSGCWMLDCRR